MQDCGAWRRLRNGLLSLLMVGLLGCATPPTTLKPDQLPPFPTYEVLPLRYPCNIGIENKGQRMCVQKLESDEIAHLKYMKQMCFIASGDKAYCRME